VRELAARVLRQHGYLVLEAANGNEALCLVEDQAGRKIDLLLTDVVMPQMGGKALVDHFVTIRPDHKVLFISGYADKIIFPEGLLDPNTAFLAKPFTPETLVRKVRAVLDA